MARFELLFGAEQFWSRLEGDLQQAHAQVVVQAMTFEGDVAGLKLAAALRSCQAQERRVLVDAYTKYFVSDRFVYGPSAWFDHKLKDEVRSTSQMFTNMREAGVQVRTTNPMGLLMTKWPARNHKKLVIVDNRVAYLGGINFSDHNFAWLDFMVRIKDTEICQRLCEDFDATWNSRPQSFVHRSPGATLYSTNGTDNKQTFSQFMNHVATAQRSIVIISPYLTFPFTELLRRIHKRGVHVTLMTPEPNNNRVVRAYLLWAASRAGFEIRLYNTMIHMKAMLIDDAELVLGSSNFDFVSYNSQEEFMIAIDDPALVADFKARVLVDATQSTHLLESKPSAWSGWMAFIALKLAAGLCWLNRFTQRKAS